MSTQEKNYRKLAGLDAEPFDPRGTSTGCTMLDILLSTPRTRAIQAEKRGHDCARLASGCLHQECEGCRFYPGDQ